MGGFEHHLSRVLSQNHTPRVEESFKKAVHCEDKNWMEDPATKANRGPCQNPEARRILKGRPFPLGRPRITSTNAILSASPRPVDRHWL
jgi:hypothetical protein